MIGITLGDPGGIGIEVVLKVLPEFDKEFILFGNRKALEYFSTELNIPLPENFKLVNIKGNFSSGKISKNNGRIAFNSIIEGLKAASSGKCGCLVTAPINKKSIFLAGCSYPGHTEILADFFNIKHYVMMMVSDSMKVIFITSHIPISNVSETIAEDIIINKIRMTSEFLNKKWGIDNPSFGVLGLNPHAGDSGLIGEEEELIIEPAIEKLKKDSYNVEGPFPPDIYWKMSEFDCIVAMYHDQGMIPFKLNCHGEGVNLTIGLPIIRTSPDHGTAFDIVGKGIANPGSMRKAIEVAIEISNE